MDSMLSEHMCEGWLEGYLLTGRHGFFASYEAVSYTHLDVYKRQEHGGKGVYVRNSL